MQPEDRIDRFRRSAEILTERLGDQHPALAVTLYDLGTAARAIFERAGDVSSPRSARGPGAAADGRPRARAGQLSRGPRRRRAPARPRRPQPRLPADRHRRGAPSAGKLDDAEPPLRRARPLREKWFEANSPVLAETVAELGLLLHQRGRHADADPLLARVLARCAELPCHDIDLVAVRAAAARSAQR